MDNKLNYTEENEEREDGKLSYRTPIYLQLREIIRNRIEEGEYLPGTAIPSENKLAETYGINRLTVRNAVDTLVNEGILRRVQGKGVFVVGDKYEENLDEHGGFVNVMSSGTKRVSIKEQAKIYRPAGNKYANYFNIEKGIYEQLLSNPDEVVTGTVKELAEKYGQEVLTMVGFLDGINDSLKIPNPIETMDENTKVSLCFDKELLYKNMVDARADWLYELPQWDAIFTPEKRKELYLEQKKSGTVVKAKKIGRNDPCPCGSGKKYKYCCGKNA